MQRVRAQLVAEGQRRGGEHHGQHDQRQIDDAHHHIDLDQLGGHRLAQAEALRQSLRNAEQFSSSIIKRRNRRAPNWPAPRA